MAPAAPPPPPSPPGKHLFELTIPAYSSPTSTSPGGIVTLTLLKPSIYLLTFYSPPDNRLTPQFLDTFHLALSILQHSPAAYPPGILLTTSSITKFYSNGLDFAGAIATPGFMANHLYPVWRKLITFPMPTVAVLNGHTFAGGLMLAMAHDYRFMNPQRGFACLNELEFNAQLAPAMSSLFKAKLPTVGPTFRSLVLEAQRFGGKAALEAGIVDGLGGVDDAIKALTESGLVEKVKKLKRGETSYGRIKEELYREAIADLDLSTKEEDGRRAARDQGRRDREEQEKKTVETWVNTAGGGKAKL